ncbi:family 16 glycoside hydrolase [Persicitalea jodogahamensis]|uniref:3-keto-alpha-glucoside-1,2-lyase/3-keto-2-hydroxy-glucal hydratase domain-containing protein n=1 Tax=Persicitalea jodogahamensis TaxID=402147 RepID=A0A8J3D8N2_9BACT|nr:family 16 glycoside hydrolase [Persicitalea jodogahamensis]GHB88381.1 hypothetical protein GCM10007390_50620 [Persicitalea jodogahamensis]
MFKFLCFCTAGFLLLSSAVLRGQASDGYTPISLNDLSAFDAPPQGWKLTPEIMMNPTNGTVMSTDKKGGGILVGTTGQTIKTKAAMQDLRLRFDFMLSPGAQAAVVLPGNQRIVLADGPLTAAPGASTSGYTGQFPIMNATKAPGLWQTIEIAYDASTTQPNMARVNSITLNGSRVQQGSYLPLSKTLTGKESIAFTVNKGTVAFRNIGYQELANRKPLTIENLTYKLYSDQWDTENPTKLDREGPAAALTQEIAAGMKEFQLVFAGNMVVSEAGLYTFEVAESGPNTVLTVDGKVVMKLSGTTSQDKHTAQTQLSEGKHDFSLFYARFPWRAPALGVSVYKSGVRPYDLTALSSLPVPPPKPYIGVDPENGTEMLRSFIQYQDEKAKRTHALSVGNPAGWHYTMDLNRGALLQAWRGPFADVTEMWYERGEPQLLETAGLTVLVSGKSSYAPLNDLSAAWPDSANLKYLGYRLNANGVPTLRYAFGNATLADQFTADAQGLTRKISIEGSGPSGMYALLGAGDAITMVEKGLYRIDDRYYVRVDKNARVTQRSSAGKQELLLPLGGTTTYSLFW